MYTEDSNFRDCVEMITALSLIPFEDIDEGWDIIKRSLLHTLWQVNALCDYVERKWLTNNRPLFNRQIWSQHGVYSGRTNNFAESIHSKLNRALNKSRPYFYEVVEKIKELQLSSSLECQRLVGGEEPKPRKPIYILQDEKIERLTNNYSSRIINLVEFLWGLKGAMKFNI
ncbi:hypothetical protein DMUE_3670 [Dictyocoela muelleri]|nr:hypothetical protein DMUE_3670 [Dictyocoela muelleri]